jgi:mono/diheme cytochrome c family protein
MEPAFRGKRSPLCAAILIVPMIVGLTSTRLWAQTDPSAAEQAIAILQKNCSTCHGEAKTSGLDMRQRDTLLKGGTRGPAVIPGSAEKSLLYLAAAHQGELKMPQGSQDPLPPGDLDVLKRWINGGLDWPADATLKMTHGPSADALEPDHSLAGEAAAILQKNCYGCHGENKAGGLDMRQRETLLKGGTRGPAVMPGDAAGSLLYRAAAHDGVLMMPPGSLAPLPPAELDVLRRWINGGVSWPAPVTAPVSAQKPIPWSFQPVKKVTPPDDATGWSRNPIDQFIMAQLKGHGLRPVASADKRTLIRRAYFDLIGLPPTPAEVSAFLGDHSRHAFEKLVDRLLASPQYGERWGRHWLDVVRYADTAGDNADYPVPEAYLYRDYVIDSFNSDKPYNQFLEEQLAGDILAKQGPPEKYAERLTATGFLALSRRYATGPYELWHLTLEDTIETVGEGFMGLTLRCARCHDHKFDPITMRDYYGLYGVFASTQYPYAGSEEFQSVGACRVFVPLLPPNQAEPLLRPYQTQVNALQAQLDAVEKPHPVVAEIAAFDRLIDAARKRLEMASRVEAMELAKSDLAGLRQHREALVQQDPAVAPLVAKWEEAQKKLIALKHPGLPAGLPGAYAVEEGKITDVNVQLQGDPARKGPLVHRSIPAFLAVSHAVDIPARSSGRLQLAQWLTRPDNPLTARVMVNRIWQYHFGKGIVGTPSNFGNRGEKPTHPELLDWLAARFVESGWSIKTMHRLILLSKTYQLSSRSDPANFAKDPSNQWYWRFDRTRLDADALRDAMLSVSGQLDLSRPGPHPFPPIDQWHWTQHHKFEAVYPTNHRSVYIMTQRLARHPYLALFDGADPNASTGRRTTSIVPLQALYLMNDPFVEEQSRKFAQRLPAAAGGGRNRIKMGCELAWGRPPTRVEMDKFTEYVKKFKLALSAAGVSSDKLDVETWSSFAHILISSNEFIYVD